jgi:energy-coupling factor transporter ATP-binding protein EcfA2
MWNPVTSPPLDVSAAVFAWASSLPTWQQRLVRRVALTPLEERDVAVAADEVAAAFGVGPAPAPLPPLTEPELGLTPASGPRVALTRLGRLTGVGAIADDQELTFAADGLTIVYGANAAGKSSYVRVLKHACRSADRRSTVHPNVFAAGEPPRRTAKVHWEVAGESRARELDMSKPPPDELAGISVFDTRCAAVYVAGDDVIAYVPSSLHVFKRLADAQITVRKELRARASALRDARPSFEEIPAGSAARDVVDTLGGETDAEALQALAAVTEEDRDRLRSITTALALDDPAERRARAHRARADAADGAQLARAVEAADRALAPPAVETLDRLRVDAATASAAVDLAAREAFDEQPGDLRVGSDPWRALWEAARAFCAHDAHAFPPGDRCPLCLQELDAEAAERFGAFETFVRGELQARATATAQRRDAALAALSPDLVTACRTSFLEALGTREPELHVLVTAWLDAAERRRAAAVAGDAVQAPTTPASPAAALRAWADARTAELRTLDASTEPAARAALEREALDLRGRVALAARLEDACAYAAACRTAQLLERACSALVTTTVTTRQGALTDQILTKSLKRKLNDELAALGLDHLRVDVNRYGAKGASQVRMSLREAKRSAPLADILSEGEQGAIALAFFLAELGATEHHGGVVFDDPVSSLDLQRRIHIAERLCEEAARRQVIVFTHDLPFLIELRDQAAKAGLEPHNQTVWRAGAEAGRVQNDAPFHVLPVKKRMARLSERLMSWPKPSEEVSPDDAWSRVKSYYNDLRNTWEMAVEETLLNGAIRRFAPDIGTKRLMKVTITDQDKDDIDRGMSRASRLLHAEPAARGMALPAKDAIAADLEELRAFVKRKEKELHGR